MKDGSFNNSRINSASSRLNWQRLSLPVSSTFTIFLGDLMNGCHTANRSRYFEYFIERGFQKDGLVLVQAQPMDLTTYHGEIIALVFHAHERGLPCGVQSFVEECNVHISVLFESLERGSLLNL